MASKAKESPQVNKARKKLQLQIEKEHQRINTETLGLMKKSIQYWLTRHSKERINLKEKAITLFDENQHPAKTKSLFVFKLLDQLKKQAKNKSSKHLEGRIKKG